MKVSILLAVFNGEKYIAKSIESVLNQSYRDFELLIGFNGTTDGSKEIANEYNDSRIKLFDYGNDKGKARTLNKLLLECAGEFIAIQDDDDIWLPDKLERQMKCASEFDIIGSQIKYINEMEEITGGVVLACEDSEIKKRSFNGDNQIANSSAIIRLRCAKEINGWRLDIDGIEDFDFYLRLMRLGYKFINLDSVEVFHRIHERSNFNVKQYDLSQILREEERTFEQKKSSWWKIMDIFKN